MKNYFSEKETECQCGCGSNNMSSVLMSKLNKAREIAGVPFTVTSGFRCETHNKNVGGVENSSHVFGYAVDIKASSSMEREKVLNGLIKAGFDRIGIAKTFIHVDVDPNKPKGVCWLYS